MVIIDTKTARGAAEAVQIVEELAKLPAVEVSTNRLVLIEVPKSLFVRIRKFLQVE